MKYLPVEGIPTKLRSLRYKIGVISKTRREQEVTTTHIANMLGVTFCEQQRIATIV